MSIWIIVSWIFVAVFTALNIFLFLKLKKASDQMLKMAFPGSKGTADAMQQMQKMMGGKMPSPQQMQQAMNMLNQMKGGRPRRG